ncbi:hypothetical protein GCM10010421_64240 [Streptomyces glaucus]|uniref:Uncharacterized protein n=1 Tax=Streptomyces glaucus TaxID=284029 RepID=A0ABP5XU07_9ACTN
MEVRVRSVGSIAPPCAVVDTCSLCCHVVPAASRSCYVSAGSAPILMHDATCRTVAENDAGRFGDLGPGRPGDGPEAHHMPRDGLGFLARDEGGAIVTKDSDHAPTRTYKSRGRRTKRLEAGLPFRAVLVRDIWTCAESGSCSTEIPDISARGFEDCRSVT